MRTPILWATESDLGWSASHIASTILPTLQHVYAINDLKSVDGVRTGSNERKLLYLERMSNMFIDGAVRMVRAPVVTNTLYVGDKPAGAATEDEFETQMRQFKKLTILPSNPTSLARMTVTGKANEAGKVAKGMRDDLVMALLLACYWQFAYEAGRTSRASTFTKKSET